MTDIIRTGGILLPEKHIDIYKWAVIACDQFTSDPHYWRRLDELVGDAPSTLRLIYPECFLGENDDLRINAVNAAMRSYIERGLFRPAECVRTVRETVYGRRRTGFVFSVDLDAYSYAPGNKAPIRATEDTIAERIPPRVHIRYNAELEIPHIMLLYSDPEFTVESAAGAGEALYESRLNMRGGRVSGCEIASTDAMKRAFEKLASDSEKVYGSPLLFLVGDGNHSLAAAARCRAERENAGLKAGRYALVEAVNIFDAGVVFEPIHRLAVTSKPHELVSYLGDRLSGDGKTKVFLSDGSVGTLSIPDDGIRAVEAVQKALDDYSAENGCRIDYIHGEESLRKASRAGVGIMLPAMAKRELFNYVASNGILPRKTFSLGEAEEKRYYLEAARIV